MNLPNLKIFIKILIIRLSSMGDIVLTTPIVRNIKNHYKDAEIDFLAGSQFIEIIKYNPYITKIIEYDKSLNLREILKYKDDLIKHNNNKKYDIVIDLQNNLRSRIFRFGLGRKVFSIKKNRIYKLCLVHCKRKISTKFSHIVQNYKKSYKALNITDDEFGLELWLPEDLSDNNYIHDRDSKGKPTLKIGIAPGAFHFTKRYPIEKYIELIKKLKDSFNCQIEMIGGKADEQICNQIYSSCSSFIESVYISTSISNSARIIKIGRAHV